MLDPAIAMSLLGVSREQLETYKGPKHVGKFNQTLIGQLLESLVYQSLIVYANANDAQLYHFRDAKGTREIDFILQNGNALILFEVKADQDAKNQYVEHVNCFEDTEKDEFQVTKVSLNTGPYADTRESDRVHVIPVFTIVTFIYLCAHRSVFRLPLHLLIVVKTCQQKHTVHPFW